MTFLNYLILAIALASPPVQDCSLDPDLLKSPRVFTNADLERMAPCRYQTGALSRVGNGTGEKPEQPGGQPRMGARGRARPDDPEADWRAQWRSVDQKARKLRGQARELRQEAEEAPRHPKKPILGRRSPSLLLTRAKALEAEARELEEEFNERARREGALPGWLRARSR